MPSKARFTYVIPISGIHFDSLTFEISEPIEMHISLCLQAGGTRLNVDMEAMYCESPDAARNHASDVARSIAGLIALKCPRFLGHIDAPRFFDEQLEAASNGSMELQRIIRPQKIVSTTVVHDPISTVGLPQETLNELVAVAPKFVSRFCANLGGLTPRLAAAWSLFDAGSKMLEPVGRFLAFWNVLVLIIFEKGHGEGQKAIDDFMIHRDESLRGKQTRTGLKQKDGERLLETPYMRIRNDIAHVGGRRPWSEMLQDLHKCKREFEQLIADCLFDELTSRSVST